MDLTSNELRIPFPVSDAIRRIIASRSSARVTRSRSPRKAARVRLYPVETHVTAMLAAAAEVGAPLGGDFCAVSLSDNLKSWESIERRLRAAATGDFVLALYNPASKARPHQLGQAFDLLRTIKPPQGVVLFVRKAATLETRVVVTSLAEADPALADMSTLVIIGAAATRLIPRPGHRPWVYTPRAEPGMAR